MACSGFKDGTNRRQDNVSAVRSFWLDIDVDNPEQTKDYRTIEEAWQALANFCHQAVLPFPTAVCSGYGIHCYWTLKNDIDVAVWKDRAAKLQDLADRLGFKIDKKRTKDLSSILRPPGTTNKKHGAKPVYVMHEAPPLDDFNPGVFQAPPAANANQNNDILGGIGGSKPDMAQGYSDGSRTQALEIRCGWLVGPMHLGFEDALTQLRQWNSFNTPPLDDAKLVHTLTSINGAEQRKRSEKVQEVFQAPEKPFLPAGFIWGAKMQLMAAVEDDTGEITYTTISEFPIHLERLVRHETSGEVSLVFKHRMPREGWFESVLTAAEWKGTSWDSILSRTGANINSWAKKHFINYVTAAQNILRENMADQKQFDQFGPREDFTQFVLGHRLYHSDGKVEPALISNHLRQRAKAFGPGRNASLAAWTDIADTMFANGCEAQGFTVLASFAAPLIHLLCDSEGGAILSLISPTTGQGKTTALEAAMSVWGRPEATKISTSDTNNSVIKQTALLGYVPIICDEKTNKDKDSSYLIEQKQIFTNGYDKGRLNRDGSPQELPKPWHTIMIEASNRPFAEIAQEANEPAMLARVLELTVELPEHIRKNRVDKDTQKILFKNCGVAGDVYLRYILRPDVMATIQAQLPIVRDRIRDKLKIGVEYRYILWLIASAAVAGAIVKKLGILHFDLDRIINYVCDRVLDREQEQRVASNNPLDKLVNIIESNIADALIVDKPWAPGKVCLARHRPSRNGMHMRIEESSRMCYIAHSAFRAYCRAMKIQSHAWLIKECEKTGAITSTRARVSLGAGTEYSVSSVACIAINMNHPQLAGGLELIEKAVHKIEAVPHE